MSANPEGDVPSNNKYQSGEVAFNAQDSEITITESETVKPISTSNNFSFSSPLTSLRSFTRRSVSRSLSDAQSDEGSETSKKLERSNSEVEVTRRSLLNMVRASVKRMIETSLSSGHMLESDDPSLQQFFILMENVFQHRLKTSKRFFGQSKCFWPALEAIEKLHSSASSITESVRSLPGIKTYLGKCRAWLRLALMQKKLAEYFQIVVDNKQIYSEWYEIDSLLLSEEASIMLGHLVGLNCIDANLCMKEYDLDNMMTTIDYSLYVKDADRFVNECEIVDEESAMQKLVDQKNYLEERNRHLETNMKELRNRANQLESANQKQEVELKDCKQQLESMKRENENYRSNLAELMLSHQKTIKECHADMNDERKKLTQSKAELELSVTRLKDQLKQETGMRMDTEKELEHEMSARQELEVAVKLQEREIERKQEALVVLREQLDVVKGDNASLTLKLQTQHQQEAGSSSLVEDAARTNKQITKLEEELEEAKRQTDVAREQAGRYSNQLDDSEKTRNVLDTNLQIERNWRQNLEEEVAGGKQEMVMLREKLEMMSSLKEEMERVVKERDRLLASTT